MKDENRTVPKLRFPGCEGDWEQCKVRDTCKINGRIGFRGYTEKDIVSKEAGGVLTFSPTNIVENRLTMDCKNTYITREKYNESPEIMIKNGDILFVKTGSTLGKSTLVTGLEEDASINPQIVVMRVKKGTEAFMSNVLISQGIMKQVAAVKIGGAVPTMTETELKNFVYYAPASDEEKVQIGTLFLDIDNLITLHQRKLDQIKEYKKGMLQKMFPKKGKTVPEVRFPGFDGEWKEKKLGQLFSFVKTKNTNGLIDNVITNSAEYGLIPQREYFDKDIAVEGHTENYTIIEKGNFVYNPRKSTSAPYGPFNCYKLDEKGVVSPLYTCLYLENPEYTEFLIWYFKTDKWHPYIQSNGAQGGARHDRVGMTNELMRGIPILLPSVSEQKQIGEFLTNLDKLITLHQRKLNEMKEYKKGLLQKMFV